jgi:hypothetical protein
LAPRDSTERKWKPSHKGPKHIFDRKSHQQLLRRVEIPDLGGKAIMFSYRYPLGDWLTLESSPTQLFLCQVSGSPEVHLQVKGASDRLMVTDVIHHVANVALQRQGEVGGWQIGVEGLSLGLSLQSPQDAVSPCRLAFFLTGIREKEWEEKKELA